MKRILDVPHGRALAVPPAAALVLFLSLDARAQGGNVPSPLDLNGAAPAPNPSAPLADVSSMQDTSATAAGQLGGSKNVADPKTGKAGWYDGIFFLRDADDNFRLYVQGRVHVDFASYFGPGLGLLPPGNELRDTFFLRRVRPELSGELFHRWQWQLSAELGPTATDNLAGTSGGRSCAQDANGVLQCSDQSSTIETGSVKPAPTDAFINYIVDPALNIQVGQFLLPFTFENRMSDNTTPFIERSLPVRSIGVPLQRDIGAMVWGEPKNRLLYYSVGIYNGDGPNRLNADDRFDVSGRVLVRPLAVAGNGSLRDLQIGVSARGGSRDARLVGYDMPSMTTQEGYAFWKPTYKDSTGRLVHILPSTTQGAFGADVFVPVGPIDAIGELIYSTTNTREAADGYQLTGQNLRAGDLSGVGWYGQIGVWVVGDRSVIGFPSYGKPTHVDLDKPAPSRPIHAMELLAKFEQLRMQYEGASRGGANDTKTPNGGINVDDLELGATYWATKHVRVSANYAFYVFSDRALWPATALAAKVDDSAKAQGHTLNEISARVGVQF